METVHFIENFNFVLAVVFTALYSYQVVYLIVGMAGPWICRPPRAAAPRRYAAVISARNEENVIGELIQSLKRQCYPRRLLDIYVVADNCTDGTARAARAAGAVVYERFNQVQKGKGYALDYLFRTLHREGRDIYDAYLVFDADNIVDPDFVAAMNRTFSTGKYSAITCYRNSRNFGANWISAGYAVWFLREAQLLNLPRTLLGGSCHVSGTGFLVSAEVIRRLGGWPFHLLTEDIEFSVAAALRGERIGYCGDAVIYDEQPTTISQSWDQRLRWSKGFYQINARYSAPLLRGLFTGSPARRWACYDMFMTVAPGLLLTLVTIVFNLAVCAACWGQPSHELQAVAAAAAGSIFSAVVNFYLWMLLYGALTVALEWRRIDMPAARKVLYTFTFPVFMFTYIPIAVAALVRKVEWKPIYHSGGRQAVRRSM